ncbi:MAG TPA: hypothetical protein VN282_04400 [Pyrinomonadaceae bacterium]|nr:hypothetical protein [Pyrinomonadaceae bacterium]
MSAILIISVFLLFVASFAILRTKRSRSQEVAGELPPGVSPRGLFDPAPQDDETPKESPEQVRRGRLRERAERGELSALSEAHDTGDAALYRFVLDGLVGRASGDPARVRELAAHVAGGRSLRASPELAEMLLGVWREGPTASSTAELLRVSALSDDAGTFGRAVTEVLQLWEAGGLDRLAAEDLRSLFEAEYWLLSSEAKRSGAGFVLKQKLADVRRRLSARARGGPETTTDAGLHGGAAAQKERP